MTEESIASFARLLVQAGAVSLLMPLLVSVVVQSGWSRRAKEIVAIVSSLAAAGLTVLATGSDPVDFLVIGPLIAIATQEMYRRFWKPSGIAPWIEEATTFAKPPEGPR